MPDWCLDMRPAIAAMPGPLVFIFLAKGLRGKATIRVILDRSSRFCLPVDVRFAPKATLDVNGDGLKVR
jgi:hypothetical protein